MSEDQRVSCKAPNPPPLGGNEIGAFGRVCSRALTWPQKQGDPVCGNEPFLHVLWQDDMENGFVCTDHAAELERKNWIPIQQHEVGPDCGMPGSWWSFKENRCYVPEDDAESGEGLHALATVPQHSRIGGGNG